jgi:type II protein arginine methyltransferase
MADASPSGFSSAFPMATVAGHLSLDDIAGAAAADPDPNFETPILRLLSDSKAKGYDTVCVPLTNEKWRTRWKGMCLSPEDEADKDESAERLSEAWRSNPVFLSEEVNVTRLGECTELSEHYLTLMSTIGTV